jgi:hypothetical protein
VSGNEVDTGRCDAVSPVEDKEVRYFLTEFAFIISIELLRVRRQGM